MSRSRHRSRPRPPLPSARAVRDRFTWVWRSRRRCSAWFGNGTEIWGERRSRYRVVKKEEFVSQVDIYCGWVHARSSLRSTRYRPSRRSPTPPCMLDCILEFIEPCQSTTPTKRSATPSADTKKKPRLSSGRSQKTSYDRQQAQKWTDEWKPRMLSNGGGKGRCVECAGKYPELECCKVKDGHFWNVYEFDGWQKSKNPSMAVASDARSYCPDCYKKEVDIGPYALPRASTCRRLGRNRRLD